MLAIHTVREFAKTDVVELRTGIHFGEAVGGLVGTKVLRYKCKHNLFQKDQHIISFMMH